MRTILSRSLRIFRAYPGLFIAVVLVSALPVGVLGIASALAVEDTSDRAQAAVGALIQLVPLVLIYPISWVAGTVATLAILHRRSPTVSGAFEPVGVRFWPMAGVLLLYTVGVVGGWLAFIAPGVFLLVTWLFASQAAVIEGLGVTGSLSRSAALIRNGWWRCFATFLVLELVTSAVIVAVLLLVGVATDGLTTNAQIVVSGAASILLTALVKPFQIIGIALLYLDRRVRLERAWPPLPAVGGARAG
ncbi:MAG: hypothetical protein AB1416_06205 [Actinomycetota bacterium]